MLKGHTFAEQVFGNQIFALFIDTFTGGRNGISNKYKNKMAVTYSGSTLTIQSGAACIQGRFVEENTSTSISAGTDNAFCKLIIEVNLDKTNTSESFLQAEYKVIKNSNNYPSLTQNDIVKNVSGIYQFELARFKTDSNGISEFQDMRTFLDFETIYDDIDEQAQALIDELEDKLAAVEDESYFQRKITTGTDIPSGGNEGDIYLQYFE